MKKAEFTNDCNGICNFVLNDDGTITLNVPLGEYTLKEVKTKYGYVLPEQSFCDLSLSGITRMMSMCLTFLKTQRMERLTYTMTW